MTHPFNIYLLKQANVTEQQRIFVTHLLDMLPVMHLYSNCIYGKYTYFPSIENKTISIMCLKNSFDLFAHELSHFVEIDNIDKLLVPEYGFTNNLFTRNSMNSFIKLSREFRVIGIQSHFIFENIKDSNINNIVQKIYDGPILDVNMGDEHIQTYEEIYDLMRSIQVKSYYDWNRDRIEYEWKRRANFIINKFAERKNE